MLERLLADVDPERRAAPRRRALRTRAGASTTPRGCSRARRPRPPRADCARPTSRAATTRATTSPSSICRNINFTNVCYVGCTFCGFSRHARRRRRLRPPDGGDPREGARRGRARRDRGLHPGRHRPEEGPHPLPRASSPRSSAEFPKLHIHAFSPEEIDYGHKKSGHAARRVPALARRTRASARCRAPPPRSSTTRSARSSRRASCARARWVEIVNDRARDRPALDLDHHVRPHRDAASTSPRHLELLRDIQKETGGFTEFVPLGFIHEKNVLFNHLPRAARLVARPRTCGVIAVARLFLRPWIQNVQMSWVKMGPKLGAARVCRRARTTSAAR